MRALRSSSATFTRGLTLPTGSKKHMRDEKMPDATGRDRDTFPVLTDKPAPDTLEPGSSD